MPHLSRAGGGRDPRLPSAVTPLTLADGGFLAARRGVSPRLAETTARLLRDVSMHIAPLQACTHNYVHLRFP